ncbi:EF-hand domain-containing protein [Pycnococcus provasolii]
MIDRNWQVRGRCGITLIKAVKIPAATAPPCKLYHSELAAVSPVQNPFKIPLGTTTNLDDGRTLARTVETARATLVVLDKVRVIPLTRFFLVHVRDGIHASGHILLLDRCADARLEAREGA